ncbi:MAG: hypothetical protein B9S37_08590 [Verrucomicrobiia bacterium Tous-C3TDCM]|nr:MAG: hypothetical protein B9S37_08590 [Verrucomicrobiae bacterium Tous-C3TDCM]PAZ07482.1 MAG: hypothetical protein CAK88_00005 [Verrucomicrobiae bacterium AMD-G2]
MKNLIPSLFLIVAISSCSKKPTSSSAALPDNVVSDKPIVLKEGQSVMLMREGDPDLMIGASVVDGKLSVAEVDPKGRNFGVTWKDSESWTTSTIVSDGTSSTYILDKNGDGYTDFRAENSPTGTHLYELQGEVWTKVKSTEKTSEQAAPSNSDRP